MKEQWEREERKFQDIIAGIMQPFLKIGKENSLEFLNKVAKEKNWEPLLKLDPNKLLEMKTLNLNALGKI